MVQSAIFPFYLRLEIYYTVHLLHLICDAPGHAPGGELERVARLPEQ